LFKDNQITAPNDKDAHKLAYGKQKDQDNSVGIMRGRNLSPSQQFLLESISSLDKLQDSVMVSPASYHLKSENPISPELGCENHRFMSEGSPGKTIDHKSENKLISKPKSSLSRLGGSRYFSMPKIRARSKLSRSNSRSGMPTYFKNAAELLKSRILKQIQK